MKIATSICFFVAAAACILLVLYGGGRASANAAPMRPAKEKFFRGNLVKVRVDGGVGMIVGKQYLSGWDLNDLAHDVWKYKVRFPCDTGGYVLVTLYEFELEPSDNVTVEPPVTKSIGF